MRLFWTGVGFILIGVLTLIVDAASTTNYGTFSKGLMWFNHIGPYLIMFGFIAGGLSLVPWQFFRQRFREKRLLEDSK